jgi:phosphatidylglycerol:prolipoprotein diacylglycerol transferase
VLLAIGFLAGFWLAARRAPRTGVDPNTVYDLIPWLLLGSIAGARTLYVISYWKQDFANAPWWEVFMVRHGGLVYYGGLLGAIVGVILFAWRKHVNLWRLADVLSPSVPVGYFFGRFGCLMNGCCYGRPTNLPWGIHFPGPSGPGSDWPNGHPSWPNAVHPTQIYDSLLNLILWCGLAWLYRRKKFDGQVFAVYLMAYAVTRSTVEFFRGDYPNVGLMTPAQLLSIPIMAGGIALYLYLSRNGRAATEAPSAKIQPPENHSKLKVQS